MEYSKVYTQMFNNPQYCKDDNTFRETYCLENMKMKKFNSLIDVGSGRGRFIKRVLSMFPDTEILSTDLANYHHIPNISFQEIDLSSAQSRDKLIEKYQNNKRDLLTCLDVLEHLDKSFIDEVFRMFSLVAKTCIFTIANHSDIVDGIELHTIQENFDYWGPIIQRYFKIVKFHDDIYFMNGRPILYILYCESLERDSA